MGFLQVVRTAFGDIQNVRDAQYFNQTTISCMLWTSQVKMRYNKTWETLSNMNIVIRARLRFLMAEVEVARK
jgi:hypothetical protein